MQIWLVRHAEAIDREAFEGPDGVRPLTARGRRQFREFARWLRDQGVFPGRIVTSPLVRAAQTADLLRKALKLKRKTLATDERLSPGAEAGDLLSLVVQAPVGVVAVVGHEPDFSRALTELVGGGNFDFQKGHVAAVTFDSTPALGTGRLAWFAGPRLRSK